MNMKKLVALLLALVMVFALCACGGDKDNGGKDSATYKVAMITDYGDITDQSFNRTVSPGPRRPSTRATRSSRCPAPPLPAPSPARRTSIRT